MPMEYDEENLRVLRGEDFNPVTIELDPTKTIISYGYVEQGKPFIAFRGVNAESYEVILVCHNEDQAARIGSSITGIGRKRILSIFKKAIDQALEKLEEMKKQRN